MRGLDVERWEFWASATDVGWGPYATESGWTVGWVAATMGLRQMNSSFWQAAEPFGKLIAADRGFARELCLRYFEGEASLCAQKS